MVRTSRINTVSFSYSSVAKNSLVVKPGDLLTVVDWEEWRRVVDLATPDSIIFWICDDKASFPETNETKEKFRVNYTPVAWDNTYKMDATWPVKVGYFYSITADGKIDASTQSPSVGQLMVQDIYESYIEVRFVSNQGLFVPQYEDTKFQSARPTNPDSQPFDWQYTVTLSDGTEVPMDLSKLARWLGDVEIVGKLTVDQDAQIKWDTLIEKSLEVSEWATIGGDTTIDGALSNTGAFTTAGGSITAEWDTTVAGSLTTAWATIDRNWNTVLNWTLTAKATTVDSLESEWDVHIEWETILDKNLTVDWYASVNGDISSMWNWNVTGTLTVGSTATIGGDTSVTGNITATWDVKANWKAEFDGTLKAGNATLGAITSLWAISASGNISGNNISWANATFVWTLEVTKQTTISNTLTATWNITTDWNLKALGNLEISHSADIDEDLNVDGDLHVGGSTQIDEALHAKKTLAVDGNTTLNGNVIINGNITLWADASAPQFVMEDEKDKPNGVPGLDLSGKLNPSVLPEWIYPKFYYETSTQGSRTYTLQHEPVSDQSIMVFSDSWTAMFPTIDYTCANGQITFVNMEATEYAIIRVIAK